jgi:hypothetical protein
MLGSGTELDPYIIQTLTDLNDIRNDLDAWYELDADIDATETASWNGGAGWLPIGSTTAPFTGNLEGNDHIIAHLTINRPGTNYVGMFSAVKNTTPGETRGIYNIRFQYPSVKGYDAVGTLAGFVNYETTASNAKFYISHVCVTVGGYVSAAHINAGGIVGDAYPHARFEYCRYVGVIYAQLRAGGIVAYIASTYVTEGVNLDRCSAYVNIYCSAAWKNNGGVTGGLVGDINISVSGSAIISESYSEGTIYCTSSLPYTCHGLGGLVGYGQRVSIYNCYSRVTVSGKNTGGVAGLIGGIYAGVIDNSYSTGLVADLGGCGNLGGLVGEQSLSSASDCFWDKETSGRLTSALGTGKTTAEMMVEALYTDAGWDFVDIWAMDPDLNDGYPHFIWAEIQESPPKLTIEYTPATPPASPKLTIDFDPGIEPMPPKLTIEHEFLAPISPKLTIEHSAPIEPVAPKLTVEFTEGEAPNPPKLTIEWIRPIIPVEISPGIQIYVNEAWQDISEYVMTLQIKRGRMHELDRVEAGTAIMVVNNEAGHFWRYNPNSDYYPEIKPLIPIRVIMALGDILYLLYNGLIEGWKPSWSSDVSQGIPIMTLEAVDMFKRFSRAFIRTVRPSELAGARIDAILDHIGWPLGEDWRSIDPGTVMISELVLDEANPENAQEHMLDVALAEGGIFFMDGAGRAVFQDADSRITGENSSTKATLTKDDFLPVQLSDDDTMIYNSAQINNQFYQTPDIDPLIGSREYKETYPLASETEALARAYIIAERYKDSILRLPAIPILPANDPERLYPMVYGYELSTKIKVQLDDPAYPAKLDQTYHIEGIQHRWEARSKLWRTDWQVWEVSQFRRALMIGCAYAMCTRIVYQSVPGYIGVWPHPGNLDPYNNDDIIHIGQQSGLNGIYISRGLIEFDTAGITAEVAEAHMFFCFSSITQGELDRDIKIVLVDPASLALPMQTGDYGTLRTKNTILGESAEFHSARDGHWLEITLNTAGIYHLNHGGTTIFGIRSNHDINADDDDLQDGEILFENAKFYGYGTGKEPYLVVKLNI